MCNFADPYSYHHAHPTPPRPPLRRRRRRERRSSRRLKRAIAILRRPQRHYGLLGKASPLLSPMQNDDVRAR